MRTLFKAGSMLAEPTHPTRHSMPAQKPGRSRQDYRTPREFLDAVERRFGRIACDLACTRENAVCDAGYFWPSVNSLEQPWAEHYPRGTLWLNPPFGRIGIDGWSAKCAKESKEREGWILMLSPAAVSTEWYARDVEKNAFVSPLRPRIAFDGTPINPLTGRPDGFIKDLQLAAFGYGMVGFQTWRWKP